MTDLHSNEDESWHERLQGGLEVLYERCDKDADDMQIALADIQGALLDGIREEMRYVQRCADSMLSESEYQSKLRILAGHLARAWEVPDSQQWKLLFDPWSIVKMEPGKDTQSKGTRYCTFIPSGANVALCAQCGQSEHHPFHEPTQTQDHTDG